MSKAREYIADLAGRGIYHFTSEAMRRSLNVSPAAAKLASGRLAKQGLAVSPARGFYVIVSPEYKKLGCLPADQFIPELMNELKLSYYAGLLTAAQYYGAAHHRPQEFQVFVERNRRPIVCGAVRVGFIANKRISGAPVRSFNTQRGTILVSTVERTALDLVGYAHHAGGLDQVATILAELADQIDPDRLVTVAKTVPVPWTQRLGYLLELVDAEEKGRLLKKYVREAARNTALLLPAEPITGSTQSKDWRLCINADIEVDT